jgi:hypothetical protein
MSDIIKSLSKPLNISDVDFRVQSINNGGYATILAYKDARVDMNRLDEVCGVHWQKDFKLIDGKLFCGVGIKFNDEWMWRWDVGTESNTEKEKGQASDSFKRACFCWGIGRELYNYPVIQVKLNPNEFSVENGKPKQTWNLQIKKWVWLSEFDANGMITLLIAKDELGKDRFIYDKRFRSYEQILEECETIKELQTAYLSLPKPEQSRLVALKDKLKSALSTNPVPDNNVTQA